MTNISDSPQPPKTPKQKLWDAVKLLLKIAITSALLYYVFSRVDFNQVKNRFLQANYWWMAAAVLCFFVSSIVSSWRLLSFFKSINLRLDWRFNLRLYLLGLFYNFLLPGGIGGDGYKIFLLNKRYKFPAKKMFLAILFDRLSGLWAIGLIVCALMMFIPQIEIIIYNTLPFTRSLLKSNAHLYLPGTLFLLGSAIYYAVASRLFKDYTKYFFEGHAKAVLVQALQVFTIILVMFGQDFDGKYAPYLLSFLVSALAAVVPVTVGGAGAREAIFQQLSGVFNMDVGLAVFLSVSFYLISLVVALTGVYYVFRTSRLEAGLPGVEEVEEKTDDQIN